MEKRKLRHIWKIFKPISYWYFFLAFLICTTTAAFALRHNNLTAVYLRNQLLQVDEHDGNTTAALNKLRGYIYSHMNTNLASGSNTIYPPIQLKYTYQRLLSAEQAEVNAGNTNLYTDAENYCQTVIPEGTSNFLGGPRVPCVENYVTTNGAKITPIPVGLYEFDFASPFWSPDLAGWSIVASFIFLLLFLARFIAERWFRYRLKQHA
jgi:hypothetical protein